MLKPLHDNVVLKKEEEENKTASGIILTSENKNKPSIGLVEAIGEGVKDAGYKVGDRVVYKEYSGTRIKIDEEEYIVIADEGESKAVYEDLLQLTATNQSMRQQTGIVDSHDILVVNVDLEASIQIQILLQILLALIAEFELL